MASGVEMLGQMSETDALAGPVQGGNMVVKPNEVPVGGAAMLAKALRGQSDKGIGGIYELPSQEQPTPQFMQMAKAGIQERDPMRGQGPRRGLTPFDRANMEGAAMQAGIINFLGGQPEVTAPIRAQSHADAPPTELAYITAAEKQMLLDANLHGSLENNQPNPGPAGIQSLDDFYNLPGGGVGGGSGQQVFDSGVDKSQGGAGGDPSQSGGYQSSEAYGIDKGMAVGGKDDDTVFTSSGSGLDKTWAADEDLTKKLAEEGEQKQEDLLQKLAAEQGIRDREDKKSKEQKDAEAEKLAILNKGEDDMTPADRKKLTKLNKLIASFSDVSNDSLFEGLLDDVKKIPKKAIEQLKKWGVIGKEIKNIEDLPKETQEEMMRLLNNFERLNVSPKEAFNWQSTVGKSMSDGEYREDDKDNPLYNEDGSKVQTLEGVKKALRALDTGGGASVLESLRKYNPELYYDKFRVRQTAGDLKAFGRNETVDTSGMDRNSEEYQKAKRYNNAIFDAREKGRDGQMGGMDNNQNNRPAVMEETQEGVIDMPGGIVDEESQTMEYTSPRTGGTETSVPLQRRFRTDPTQDVAQYRTTPRTESDIYKYMTEGTPGEGIDLEPFSEYQKRRRKAMGLDPLELYG